MQRPSRSLFGALTLAITLAVSPALAHAGEMFAGKTIKIVVGYAAGGGYDRYARQVGRYIGKYLPGNPNVVVENMPGAGSATAANYLYNVAPKDGTVFGEFARSMPILALSGKAKGVRFDPLKFTWIGTSSSYKDEAYLMVIRKDTGIRSVADLQSSKKTLHMAATSFGSDGTDLPMILRDVLRLNIEPLLGYPGGNTLYLAVDRDEAEGRMTGYASIMTAHREWLAKDSPVRVILQVGHKTRIAAFPNVPTAYELARTEADRNLIELMQITFSMARPFAAPPGVPADRAKALRNAFMKAHSDPGYIAEAKKFHLKTSPSDGAEVEKVVERLSRIPRPVYDRYSKILAHPRAKVRQVKWQVVDGKISNLGKKGKFEFALGGDTKKSRMTKNYTKITVAGQKAKTDAVKVGMNCKIWYEGDGSYAGRMDCK